jgi:Zn-dependent peptidase ImmA (M78 family)
MGQAASAVNYKMLAWARKRSGHSVAEVAAALKRAPELIESWESGDAVPTYAQLENLAYRVYKRPVALFFFPEPPDEPDPEHSFRTLPAFEIGDLAPDTRFKIRQALALQASLYDLNDGLNPSERKIFRELKLAQGTGVTELAGRVRAFLGVDIRTQTAWRNTDVAFKAWRAAVENVGVFVFKNTFKQREVSGFCLYDVEFPLIYLNNSTSLTRQIFTVFHELGHILARTSGVTKRNDRYIGQLRGEPRRIEIFCNQFAAELLLPAESVEAPRSGPVTDERVQDLAETFKVSREVVLRRFLDLGLVSQARYETKAKEWAADYEKGTDAPTGRGNYYLTQSVYFGDNYLQLAFRKYFQGAISAEQLAGYLNIKVSSVPGLEQLVLASGERL